MAFASLDLPSWQFPVAREISLPIRRPLRKEDLAVADQNTRDNIHAISHRSNSTFCFSISMALSASEAVRPKSGSTNSTLTRP